MLSCDAHVPLLKARLRKVARQRVTSQVHPVTVPPAREDGRLARRVSTRTPHRALHTHHGTRRVHGASPTDCRVRDARGSLGCGSRYRSGAASPRGTDRVRMPRDRGKRPVRPTPGLVDVSANRMLATQKAERRAEARIDLQDLLEFGKAVARSAEAAKLDRNWLRELEGATRRGTSLVRCGLRSNQTAPTLARGASQRTVQRALEALAAADKVQASTSSQIRTLRVGRSGLSRKPLTADRHVGSATLV